MDIAANVTLEELLFELEYNDVGADFVCTACLDATRPKIAEINSLRFKIKCARCDRSTWGGRRYHLRWHVRGFEDDKEIYDRVIELGLDAIRSHLQDLARRGLVRGNPIRPEMLEVRRIHEPDRLGYVCGVDPHYVAVTVRQDK